MTRDVAQHIPCKATTEPTTKNITMPKHFCLVGHTRSIRPSLITFCTSIFWHCTCIFWHCTCILWLFFWSFKAQGHHELQSFSRSRIESRCCAGIKPNAPCAHPAPLGLCRRGCLPRQGSACHQERGRAAGSVSPSISQDSQRPHLSSKAQRSLPPPLTPPHHPPLYSIAVSRHHC